MFAHKAILVLITISSVSVLANGNNLTELTLDDLDKLSSKIDALIFKYDLILQNNKNISCSTFSENDTLSDNSWLLISQRFGRDHDQFDKRLNQYKIGFGEITSNYWIGLDRLYELTRIPKKVRLEFVMDDNNKSFMEYVNFQVASERDGYYLTIGNQIAGHLDRGEEFSRSNGMYFSTADKWYGDRNCPSYANNKAGWWFNSNDNSYTCEVTRLCVTCNNIRSSNAWWKEARMFIK